MGFSIVTYNILADPYIKPQWFSHVPAQILENRHKTLLNQLEDMHAEILCLQEVELHVYQSIEHNLAKFGYEGHYAQKSQGRPDGCAMFWERETFKERSTRIIHYSDGRQGRADSGHVAQLVYFDSPYGRIGIANTHLRWDPPETVDEERLGMIQIKELLSVLEKEREWVICGDFNVTPESSLLTVLKQAGYSDACPGNAPTWLTPGRAERLDYVFHTAGLMSRLGEIADLTNVKHLPSAQNASDHIPLTAYVDVVKG